MGWGIQNDRYGNPFSSLKLLGSFTLHDSISTHHEILRATPLAVITFPKET